MRILFVSNYFPPEVNAPAVRLIDHARQWVRDGHDVEVLTSVPHFPEGKVYKGFENRLVHDDIDGIEALRVPMYVTENKGSVKRIISYVSFMLSALWFCKRTRHRPDLVVATSPQFFAGVGGWLISRRLDVPFVLEIRDLWPESIVAVGAMSRNGIIRMLERLESYLYRKADHIVVVTNSFRTFIEKKGISRDKISVLKNGIDFSAMPESLDEDELSRFTKRLNPDGKFVVSYIGTIGMAHRVDILLDAAERCIDPDILFMVVGTGAERENLEDRAKKLGLSNFRLVDKQPKEAVPFLLAISHVSVVHLRRSDLFKTVIPSKIFEAMAMRTPIVLGVEGESKQIVEQAGAGIPITPENVDELLEAVKRLKNDEALYTRMAQSAHEYVHDHHDRRALARRYWSILEDSVASASDVARSVVL